MKKGNVYSLVITALFVAIIVVLGLTPIGLIRLGFYNATTLCIPVLIGAIFLGWKKGLILGAAFGCISAYGAFGSAPSALIAPIVSASPILALAICFLPRLLVPVSCFGVYRLVRDKKAAPYIIAGAVTVLSAVAAFNSYDTLVGKLGSSAALGVAIGVPAVWAVVFALIIFLYRFRDKRPLDVPMAAAVGSLTNTVCYLGMIYFAYRLIGLDASGILGMLIGFGMFVGMIEAIIAAVISSPVVAALGKIETRSIGR